MWFDNSDIGNRNQIYSLKEKKTRYKNEADINKTNEAYQQRYKDFSDSLLDGDSTFGNVYVVKDSNFYGTAPKYKSRQVVSLGIDQGLMTVVPVRKNKNIVRLSNFDNCRDINLKLMRKMHLDDIYEKQDFSNTSNSTLTSQEIAEIKRKMSGDYNY